MLILDTSVWRGSLQDISVEVSDPFLEQLLDRESDASGGNVLGTKYISVKMNTTTKTVLLN